MSTPADAIREVVHLARVLAVTGEEGVQYDTKKVDLSGLRTDTYKEGMVRKITINSKCIPEKHKPLGLKQDTEKHPQTSGQANSHAHGLDDPASPGW